MEHDDAGVLYPTTMGRIASYYYLHYLTADLFYTRLTAESSVQDVLTILCASSEFDDLPVRHNEDQLNAELAAKVSFVLLRLSQCVRANSFSDQDQVGRGHADRGLSSH